MRFYVEGYEIDVQDPSFFVDVEEYQDYQEEIEEILDYTRT